MNLPSFPTKGQPVIWVFMGSNPQESIENTINTMGTRTLGVHPSLSPDKKWAPIPSTFPRGKTPSVFFPSFSRSCERPEDVLHVVARWLREHQVLDAQVKRVFHRGLTARFLDSSHPYLVQKSWNASHFGGIKQCKCMEISRGIFLIIMWCYGWCHISWPLLWLVVVSTEF